MNNTATSSRQQVLFYEQSSATNNNADDLTDFTTHPNNNNNYYMNMNAPRFVTLVVSFRAIYTVYNTQGHDYLGNDYSIEILDE